MTEATRDKAVALLECLRDLVSNDAAASLLTAWTRGRRSTGRAYAAAHDALQQTQFYSLTRSRPAMVRAVNRAIRLLAREARRGDAMTAEGLLLRLRACARRRDLPTLSDLTDSRGPTFMRAYSALVHAGYYRMRNGYAPKLRRQRIDAALDALKAGR